MNKKMNLSVIAGLALLLVFGFNTSITAYEQADGDNLIAMRSDSVEVYNVVDKMPEIIGGLKAVYENIKYPTAALQNNIQGRVFVRFIVDEDGNVKNPQILKDIGAGCGEAALNAVQKVKFTPGEQAGKKVKVYYSLPINFEIRD